MLATLHAATATGTLAEALKPYVLTQLLIIDEVGLDRPERDTSRDAHLFYKVIAPRYEKQRSTIITSNIDWENWGDYLGDDIATVAILDRLVHQGHLVSIKGPSWRAEQHKKLNAAEPSPSTDEAGS
jgi:DNA replication protein DnaC